jgi:hypothetical protein
MENAAERTRALTLFWWCSGAAILTGAWAFLFRFTGEGDAILHYQNARDAAERVAEGLSAWARPLYKLPLAAFAVHGVLAARLFNACVTAACLWQTVRLAEDLRLRNPLAAGAMLLFLPPVFALAADTMTEIPMALGVVVALRLWLLGQVVWSGLVAGLLPLVRPEGFLLCTLWAGLVLFRRGLDSRLKAAALAAMLAGTLAWSAACQVFIGDWLFVWRRWSWPPGSYQSYGAGPIWHFAARWPEFCGLPLFVAFLWGALAFARGARPRGMGLVVLIWALVFGAHTVLYWRGLFASCGFIRVLACTAPLTALICLLGWNAAPRRGLGWFLAACAAWAMLQYFLYGERWYVFPTTRAARWIEREGLLSSAPAFVGGNKIVTHALDRPPAGLVEMPFLDPEGCRRLLSALPPGAIVVWDDRRAEQWFGVRVDDLTGAGFAILREERFFAPTIEFFGGGAMRFVVLKKLG